MGRPSKTHTRTVILLDTNIVIDAQNEESPFFSGAEKLIVDAVATSGAAVNALSFTELCAGRNAARQLDAELRSLEIEILDLPAGTAPICGRAYSLYREARSRSGGGEAPPTPLPDFVIGAHAELMGWRLATRDPDRIRTYFPAVRLLQP